MVSLNFLGDIALFKVFEEKEIDPFKEVILPYSDYVIGNFEFIIPKKDTTKYFFDVSASYKVNHEYLRKLKLDTFNSFSLANNHCMDYGIDGVKDVLQVFNEKKIQSFGFGEKKFSLLIFKIKEVSFAIIACVKQGRWSRGLEQNIGPDSYHFESVCQEIDSLKENHDHVIVFPHWGTELVDVPDPKDVINARVFIDCGASAVIGHHPHIIQGIEKYKTGIIAYSLGSFIYVPEKEVGYSKAQGEKRNYSICLNLTFDKHKIKEFKAHFYEYCETSLVPKLIESSTINSYFREINNGINKKGEYNKKIRKQLIVREIKSFFQRFKKSPIKAILHYFNYIKIDHFKKLIK